MAMEMTEADQMKTFKDFLVQYNKLSELCFNDCVHDFTSRTLRSSEERCTLNCMEKYLRANQRVSQRFHEFQMIANENMLALSQKSGTPSHFQNRFMESYCRDLVPAVEDF